MRWPTGAARLSIATELALATGKFYYGSKSQCSTIRQQTKMCACNSSHSRTYLAVRCPTVSARLSTSCGHLGSRSDRPSFSNILTGQPGGGGDGRGGQGETCVLVLTLEMQPAVSAVGAHDGSIVAHGGVRSLCGMDMQAAAHVLPAGRY